jgi:hypothetical protein
MELFEIKTKNVALRTLHKILLATGIVTLFYLLLKLLEGNFNGKSGSVSGGSRL